ncbi:uncharacterized protein LAJ45_06313 [Morchella importuna]|uniref:uncharacterized protein n=1 Tax=Morchella importuna TaxID=1174673 RepID=UPI001E8E461C|nr:uncharacterized protein LAJ45_06313 [Morchella importuna]KAH8149682.1 hypothetical protein LAJ45_06313 [Morchella importuna]
MSPQIWLITGTSSGFGGLLTKAALAHGDKVIATARDPAKIADLKALGAATLALDVTDTEENVNKTITAAVEIYGHIDILVNNAAYILEGAIEECSPEEEFKSWNTNVFGVTKVLRAVLPYMRLCRSGMIANMGSIGGWRGYGGAEVAPLGIDVVCIEPGYFRTNFLAPGHRTSSAKHIADYDPVMEPLRNMLSAYNGKQPGDPEKGARVIVEILTKTGRVQGKVLPGRIPLGSDALKVIGGFCADTGKTLEEWKDIASSTDHDDVAKN